MSGDETNIQAVTITERTQSPGHTAFFHWNSGTGTTRTFWRGNLKQKGNPSSWNLFSSSTHKLFPGGADEGTHCNLVLWAHSGLLWIPHRGTNGQESPGPPHLRTPKQWEDIEARVGVCALLMAPCGCRSVRWLRICVCASAASPWRCESLTSSGCAWKKHHSWSSAAEGNPLPLDHPHCRLEDTHKNKHNRNHRHEMVVFIYSISAC